MFFTSITSHMPFHPVPPYQNDWQKVLSDTPFDPAQMAKVREQKEDWFNMLPGYTGMLDYNYQWLAGYLAQPKTRESVYVLLGDHQPAANVTGEGASLGRASAHHQRTTRALAALHRARLPTWTRPFRAPYWCNF